MKTNKRKEWLRGTLFEVDWVRYSFVLFDERSGQVVLIFHRCKTLILRPPFSLVLPS